MGVAGVMHRMGSVASRPSQGIHLVDRSGSVLSALGQMKPFWGLSVRVSDVWPVFKAGFAKAKIEVRVGR